jgi:hypothetical protein
MTRVTTPTGVGAVLLALAVVTLVADASGSCLPSPPGLVGWWPGDGNANDITGTNNGTLQGSAAAAAAGLVAQAFSFDGTNGYVQIPDAPALKPTNLTVEAWVYFSGLNSALSGTAPAGDQYIVFKQNSRTYYFEGYSLEKYRITNGDAFMFTVGSASGQEAALLSKTLISTSVWYHVAAVRGSNYMQLYVNGQLESQTNVGFAQDYGTLPLYFGTSHETYWDGKLKGRLDEVSLYNRALSSNEVAAVYAAGAAGKCKAVNGLTITAQPQSQSVVAGSNAVFTAAAAGAAPLNYQWQFNGGAIAGATNTSLTLVSVQSVNAGSYTVVVTNSAASATSAVAVLTVLVPPVITAQPQGLTNVAGTTANFSGTATGSAPLAYQWQLNGLNLANGGHISGARTNTLSVINVQAADAGNYVLVVSNAAGVVISAVATLILISPPSIAAQPISQSVVTGTNTSFSVNVSGTLPLSYQWSANGTNVADGGQFSGSATPTLSILGVQPTNAGGYSVVVTNVAGSVTSVVAALTVVMPGSCAPPPPGLVGWWPGDGNANDITGTNNGTLQGGATASATGVVAQALNFDGTNSFVQIPDSPALKPTNLTLEAWVNFSGLDSALSGTAPAGDQYIVFKQNSRTYYFEGYSLEKYRFGNGDSFMFTVGSAAGQEVMLVSKTMVRTSVWYHVAAIRGSNFIQLYVNGQLESQTNVAFAQDYGPLPLYFGTSHETYWDGKLNGRLDEVSLYNRALSSNEVAALYAAGAAGKCKVVTGLTINTQPRSQTLAAGSSATFSVGVTGAAPLGYQWQFNGTNLSGATGATLNLGGVRPTDAGSYTVVATNPSASATSAVAVLTVLLPPVITAQPQSLTNLSGTTANFSATASGSTPLNYQWQLNGVSLANGGRISGTTSNALGITNVQPADAGTYTLVVSNAVGVVTSAIATLTVSGPPVITAQPASQSVVAGSTVTFSVTASGTPPLRYQWQFNGASLAGAIGTSLALAAVQLANAGSYTTVVTNSAGSATSAVAVLTVLPTAGTLIVNGAQTYQTIDGFGVNANSGSWTNNEVQPLLDAFIDQAGVTLFLAEFVGNDNWETSNANPGSSLTNWTYFNSVYSGPNFQQLWGMMAYLNQRGITNGLMPKFTGATALWMGGESLASGHENDYAKMLASALIYARQTQHLQFTEVPPLNEPDLIGLDTGVQLSGGSQYVTVLDALGRQLDANGMSDVRFSGPELATTSTSWMGTMMGDAYLMSKLAHFGLHSYIGNGPDASGVSSFIQQSAYPNSRFWMTEFGVWCQSCLNGTGGDNSWAYASGTAGYLLTLLGEGATGGIVFEAWDGVFRGYNSNTGQDTPGSWDYWGLFAVDNINAAHKTYTPRKQFYTFSQISKYVRPGATRIGVSGASSPLTVLAFNNTNNGQFTLTGLNTGGSATTLSCSLTSLPAIPSLGFYYTSSTTNLCYGGSVAVNNGAFSVLVPANCVFTLTYTNPVTIPAAVPISSARASSPVLACGLAPNGQFQLTVTGQAGQQYSVEISDDLVNWSELTAATNQAQVSVPMSADRVFYRARLLP